MQHNKDITDFCNWMGLSPDTYLYQDEYNIAYVMEILYIPLDADVVRYHSHPFGFADLYIARLFSNKDGKPQFDHVSNLVEDKTITFCMEVAKACQNGTFLE